MAEDDVGAEPVLFQRLAGLCRAIAVADAILPVGGQRIGVLRGLVVGLVDDDLGPFDGVTSLRWVSEDDVVPTLRDEPAEQLPVLAGESSGAPAGCSWVRGVPAGGRMVVDILRRTPERKRRGAGRKGLGFGIARQGPIWDANAAYRAPEESLMTLTTRIAWDDTVLPFQLDRSDIRGRVARLDTTLEQILEQHDYPPEVEALVAEMALLTAMIGQTIKLRWKLSLQVRGDGPIRLIATDFFAPPRMARPRASAPSPATMPRGWFRAPIRSRRPARAISRS
jgi:hypothetical protein